MTPNSHEPDVTNRSLLSNNYISDYNELRDTLQLMHATTEIKVALIDNFCNHYLI